MADGFLRKLVLKFYEGKNGDNFSFDGNKFKVTKVKSTGFQPTVWKDVIVRGKFTFEGITYYILWGVKESSGRWKLIIAPHGNGDGFSELLLLNEYRLHQMKDSDPGFKFELIEEPLLSLDGKCLKLSVLSHQWFWEAGCPTL